MRGVPVDGTGNNQGEDAGAVAVAGCRSRVLLCGEVAVTINYSKTAARAGKVSTHNANKGD